MKYIASAEVNSAPNPDPSPPNPTYFLNLVQVMSVGGSGRERDLLIPEATLDSGLDGSPNPHLLGHPLTLPLMPEVTLNRLGFELVRSDRGGQVQLD